MKKFTKLMMASVLFAGSTAFAQTKNAVVDNIVKEETDNSQLEKLAHELFDGIGPRLVGTPGFDKAGKWALDKYKGWGITARQEKWGEWRGWERGISHIDMVYAARKNIRRHAACLEPGMKKPVTAEVIILPEVADSVAFQKWLPAVKGKFVMISMSQPTGRPDDNWKEFALSGSIDKMKAARTAQNDAWRKRISNTGFNARKTCPLHLKKQARPVLLPATGGRFWG
jgi:carboxypeptidase Q